MDNWKITNKRFVAFFDIMGFKELVERNNHKDVVEKLQDLKGHLSALERYSKSRKARFSETKSITFSDSIVFFSKGSTAKDANKILFDSAYLLYTAFKNGIPIKGALSFGEITVDFENSLFFGRPIIDAYLLHDQLQMYSAVLDNTFEEKFSEFKLTDFPGNCVIDYKANFKGGKVKHKILCCGLVNVDETMENLNKLYKKVSGTPRVYVDNTLDFMQFIKDNESVSR